VNVHALVAAATSQVVSIAIVFVAVWIADSALERRGNVRARAFVWGAFWLKLVVPVTLPVESSFVPSWAPSAVLARATQAPIGAWSVDSQPPTGTGPFGWSLVALGIAVASALLAVAVVRARRERVRWTRRSDERVPAWLTARADEWARRSGLARTPRLRVGNDEDGAAAVGLLDPFVVVPASALRADRRSELEHLLLHEFAHVARRDAWRSAAWTLVRCVYWFHPCVHAAAARASLVREMACDERAARTATAGLDAYRRTLLELARPLAAEPRMRAGAVSFLGSRAQIVARLERLARGECRAPASHGALGAALVLVACACCLPVGVVPSRNVAPLPGLDEVQGCLRQRYLVMAAMAQSSDPTRDAP